MPENAKTAGSGISVQITTLRTVWDFEIYYFAYCGGYIEIKIKIYSKILEWKQICHGTKVLLIA